MGIALLFYFLMFEEKDFKMLVSESYHSWLPYFILWNVNVANSADGPNVTGRWSAFECHSCT
jgi:hypothetical protein